MTSTQPIQTLASSPVKPLDPQVLQEATRRLAAEFQPQQIWLFGSHAWGTPHADSDLDLLVVVSESNERPARRMQRAHRCLRGLRASKDVLVQTRSEFDRYRDVQTSLTRKILQEGRKLYG